MEAVRHIPIDDREAFKYALAATLVKSNAHWRSFETVFEVYFSLRGKEYLLDQGDQDDGADDASGEADAGDQPMAGQGGAGGRMTNEELAEMLYRAMLRGDEAMMRAI